MEKVILYASARTQEEVDKKLTKLREACKDKKIVEEFIDIPFGIFYGRRDGLSKIKRRVKRKLINSVYVCNFRDLTKKLSVIVKIIKQFKMFGIDIVSIEDEEKGTEFVKGLELAFGEYENNNYK